MPTSPPRKDDARDPLDEQARSWRAKHDEARAVVERIKRYVEPWMNDKRMRIMGGILLREIERVEKEEAEKTARGERDG